MNQFKRPLVDIIKSTLKRGKSVLFLGPRQTGKTTLVKTLEADLYLNFMDLRSLQRYETNPGSFISETETLHHRLGKKPLIILDEVQKIPGIMDAVQILIDDKIAQFVLTGSSVRRLTNLLPGRVIKYQFDPLNLSELQQHPLSPLEDILNFGTLPGIYTQTPDLKEDDLSSYVAIYLEEEIRKESTVRHLDQFSRFLQLACTESGNMVSFRALSQEIGVSHSTIAGYYQILETCMIVERFDPITNSASRKRLTKSSKYLLFDMGIRRVGALEGVNFSAMPLSRFFEQWIGLELRRFSRKSPLPFQVQFWRDHDGPEVDWVIKHEKTYIPIEVKWTEYPTLKDAKHLLTFMNEYPSKKGYIICRTPRAMQLSDTVLALPWQELYSVFPSQPQ